MKKQYETPWFDVEDIVTEQSILLPASLPTDDDEEVDDMYGNKREEKTWGNLW